MTILSKLLLEGGVSASASAWHVLGSHGAVRRSACYAKRFPFCCFSTEASPHRGLNIGMF